MTWHWDFWGETFSYSRCSTDFSRQVWKRAKTKEIFTHHKQNYNTVNKNRISIAVCFFFCFRFQYGSPVPCYWFLPLFIMLVICSMWNFCINFSFLKYCIKILFTFITEFFWCSLKCCAQGQRPTGLTLILALTQKAQILPSLSTWHSDQSDHPCLIVAHEDRRLKCDFFFPGNRCCICKVVSSSRGQMTWRVVGTLHRS